MYSMSREACLMVSCFNDVVESVIIDTENSYISQRVECHIFANQEGSHPVSNKASKIISQSYPSRFYH